MLKIHAKLPVVFFKEGKKFIAYSPAIDLSSCGNTFSQAQKRFNSAVNIFFEEIVKMNTLDDVLRDYGWRKVSYPQKHWVPPVIIGQTEQEIKIPV